jgi:hypothetical protein
LTFFQVNATVIETIEKGLEMKLTENQKDIIENFCDHYEYDFREDYSGRCMYGDNCIGFVTDDNPFTVAINLMDYITNEEDQEENSLKEIFMNARPSMDNMGRRTIIYFTSISV